MHMDTRRSLFRFNERGGELEIDYVLDLEHAFVTRNLFRIEVKELKPVG